MLIVEKMKQKLSLGIYIASSFLIIVCIVLFLISSSLFTQLQYVT